MKRNDSSSLSTALLAGLLARDTASWERLDRLCRPFIRFWARRAGVRDSDLDDVAQDVMVTVARKLPTFRYEGPDDTFRGWLRTIVRSRASDWLRKSRHFPEVKGGTEGIQLNAQVPAEDDGSSEEFADIERRLLVEGALDLVRSEFEPTTFEIFVDVIQNGRDRRDVALERGVTIWAVHKAISRVMGRLRSTFGPLAE